MNELRPTPISLAVLSQAHSFRFSPKYLGPFDRICLFFFVIFFTLINLLFLFCTWTLSGTLLYFFAYLGFTRKINVNYWNRTMCNWNFFTLFSGKWRKQHKMKMNINCVKHYRIAMKNKKMCIKLALIGSAKLWPQPNNE